MRCYCCDTLLTRKEEKYNVEHPSRDRKEWCLRCLSEIYDKKSILKTELEDILEQYTKY